MLAVLLAASMALGQKPPTNKSTLAGMTLTLQGCSQAAVNADLVCTVEVVNPSQKVLQAQINPSTVQALTSTGWLYQGRASTTSLQLKPGAKTTLRLVFPRVDNPTGIYAMIQVGDARFLGVVVPGAPKVTASDGFCSYLNRGYSRPYFACYLEVTNDTDNDLNLRLYTRESFVITESGDRFWGEFVGQGTDGNDTGDYLIPAKGKGRLIVNFGRYQVPFYMMNKVQLIRFRVGAGFLEMRDARMAYCGQNADQACEGYW
jgi:hypothetical protein